MITECVGFGLVLCREILDLLFDASHAINMFWSFSFTVVYFVPRVRGRKCGFAGSRARVSVRDVVELRTLIFTKLQNEFFYFLHYIVYSQQIK